MTGYALPGVVTLRYPIDGPAPDDLAARVAADDPEAFALVYRTHFAEVRAFAERVLGSRAAAEDVVHDVFLALPRSLRSFRGDGTLLSFLLGMAVRATRSRYRAAVRRRKYERAAQDSALPAPARPDEDAERRELAHALALALDALPLDRRVAFVLCEVEERTSAEAAEILGENASTIRSRVFHAKKKLRRELSLLAPAASPEPESGGRR